MVKFNSERDIWFLSCDKKNLNWIIGLQQIRWTEVLFNWWASTRENLSSGVCEQHRRRPACASAQSDQRLCYSLCGKYHIWTCYRWNFNFLDSPCSWGVWFETRLVGNPEDQFCRDEAHLTGIQRKVQVGMCIQRKFKSVCASTQANQSLPFQHEETLNPWLSIECPSKTLIRLRECDKQENKTTHAWKECPSKHAH